MLMLMQDQSFHERFEEEIRWHHITADGQHLRHLLSQNHMSGAIWTLEDETRRAEFDEFGTFYVIRLLSLKWQPHATFSVVPVYVFANQTDVITFSHESLASVERVRQKLGQNPHWVESTARLVYYLLDELLGALFPFLDELNEHIANLEQEVFHTPKSSAMQKKILSLKREALRARGILSSMRDAISQVVRHWTTTRPDDSFYYMELYDHMLRLFDTIDTYRELVNSVLDLYLSTVSNHLNEIVKTLTLVTTVLLPASLMAALYGMNFDYLPLAHMRWGFFVILAIIGAISATLYGIFRRRNWL